VIPGVTAGAVPGMAVTSLKMAADPLAPTSSIGLGTVLVIATASWSSLQGQKLARAFSTFHQAGSAAAIPTGSLSSIALRFKKAAECLIDGASAG